MKLLTRIGNLFKSNLNAAIDSMSDPAKEIDLLVTEMEEEARKARLELRDTLAREKMAQKKVEEAYRNVQRWQEHAERAVTAGDDELAREALRRRDDAERHLEESERSMAEGSQMVARMTEQLRRNDAKISEIKSRKETLKARARQSKQAMQPEGDAFSRFDSLVADLEFKEHQVDAMAEIVADRSLTPQNSAAEDALAERFNRLLPPTSVNGQSAVVARVETRSVKEREIDDRLAALKARLDKKDPGTVT